MIIIIIKWYFSICLIVDQKEMDSRSSEVMILLLIIYHYVGINLLTSIRVAKVSGGAFYKLVSSVHLFSHWWDLRIWDLIPSFLIIVYKCMYVYIRVYSNICVDIVIYTCVYSNVCAYIVIYMFVDLPGIGIRRYLHS